MRKRRRRGKNRIKVPPFIHPITVARAEYPDEFAEMVREYMLGIRIYQAGAWMCRCGALNPVCRYQERCPDCDRRKTVKSTQSVDRRKPHYDRTGKRTAHPSSE